MDENLIKSFKWVGLLFSFAFITESLCIYIKYGLVNTYPLPTGINSWYEMAVDMERLMIYSIIIMSAILTDVILNPNRFMTWKIWSTWTGLILLASLITFYILHKVFEQSCLLKFKQSAPRAEEILHYIESSLPLGAFLISVVWKYSINVTE